MVNLIAFREFAVTQGDLNNTGEMKEVERALFIFDGTRYFSWFASGEHKMTFKDKDSDHSFDVEISHGLPYPKIHTEKFNQDKQSPS